MFEMLEQACEINNGFMHNIEYEIDHTFILNIGKLHRLFNEWTRRIEIQDGLIALMNLHIEENQKYVDEFKKLLSIIQQSNSYTEEK
jgi:hypothetical protein